MVRISDKVMFEIYREADFNQAFRVIYFTELHEHNKEYEINRAMKGMHIYDGFIRESCAVEAKRAVAALLARLNSGEILDPDAIDNVLSPYRPEIG